MDLTQAIYERRSVRKFKPDRVADDLVNAVLEAGRWAPSWANTQCSRFVIVRNSGIRMQLAAALDEKNPAAEAIRNASVVIAVCGELEKSGYYKGEVSTDKGDWYMFDTALATQNMALAAHGLGLGTVITGLFDASKVAEILGLPRKIVPVVLLPLGYPSESPMAPRRKTLSEIVYRDGYGKS